MLGQPDEERCQTWLSDAAQNLLRERPYNGLCRCIQLEPGYMDVRILDLYANLPVAIHHELPGSAVPAISSGW